MSSPLAALIDRLRTAFAPGIARTAQANAVFFAEPDQAPKLTEDAALLLVDERLKNAGAHAPCTREEARLPSPWGGGLD